MKIIKAANLAYIPASHEAKNDPEVWKKILLTHEDLIQGRVQMVNWAKLPVGRTFRAHYHEDMEEVFIILSGKVNVRVGDEEVILERGDTVVVPPRLVHEMKNLADFDVEYLVIGITERVGGRTVVV